MKFLLTFLLFLAYSVSDAANPYAPAALRQQYQHAATDKQAGARFYELMAAYQQHDAVALAYKAAAEAIRARDAAMFDKLTYVQQAARTFEQAVRQDDQNAEVRFLRLSVESNLPAFLGLSPHVDDDRQFLLKTLLEHPRSGMDAESFDLVRDFLVERGHVSDADAQKLARL